MRELDFYEMSAGATTPQRILPYYQPIVSVSDGMIYGYEVLGRFVDDSGRVWSMGPYFSDPEVPNHEKLIRSRKIRELAFLHARDMEYDGKLFINVKPSWLIQVHRSGKDIPTLKFIQEMGINGENIVIEITEEEFDGEIDVLDTVMRRYREAGCKIAIDDFTFNNFDRLIHLRPDFVKIDIRLVKKSVEKQEYQKLITSISDFAQEIGISVLFEGVEYEEELVNSIHAGGSYIQGFLFSPPECDFQEAGRFRPSMHKVLSSVVQAQRDDNFGLLSLEFRMNELITGTLDAANFENNPDAALSKILSTLPDACYRAYVCNQFGEQLSSNFARSKPGPFLQEPQFRSRNWGWRPYFLHNLTRMERFRRGFISNRYIDQETKRETFTYSHPLQGQLFLFLDFTRGSFASPESTG